MIPKLYCLACETETEHDVQPPESPEYPWYPGCQGFVTCTVCGETQPYDEALVGDPLL